MAKFRQQKHRFMAKNGGEDGIRTHEALLEPTPLAGERLRPLGHLSVPAPIDGDSMIDKVFRGAMRFWLWPGSTGAGSTTTYDSADLACVDSSPMILRIPTEIPATQAPLINGIFRGGLKSWLFCNNSWA